MPLRFDEIFESLSASSRGHQARWDTRVCPSSSYWGRVNIPARLYYGRWDKNGTPANGEDLAAKLDCPLTLYEDAGHFLVREKEDEIVAGIGAFVASLP